MNTAVDLIVAHFGTSRNPDVKVDVGSVVFLAAAEQEPDRNAAEASETFTSGVWRWKEEF